MPKFRTDNTPGYTQDQLDYMNYKYAVKILQLDENDIFYNVDCKKVADQILHLESC